MRRLGRFEFFLLIAVCFAILAVGAFYGGAADIGLAGLIVGALAGRGAWRARRR